MLLCMRAGCPSLTYIKCIGNGLIAAYQDGSLEQCRHLLGKLEMTAFTRCGRLSRTWPTTDYGRPNAVIRPQQPAPHEGPWPTGAARSS